ncbi:MAG: glycoside hydrolase family 2 TIM barrel-domain containing protein [Bryobacteraceae bacterium]
MPSRRLLLKQALAFSGLSSPAPNLQHPEAETRITRQFSLDGQWLFRTDPDDVGEKENWYASKTAPADWRSVEVPHTWQVEAPLTEYRGVAWYRRTFDRPLAPHDSAIRLEFEAIFHSAKVWVNGVAVGEHLRKGYTAFTLDTGKLLDEDKNTIAVRVDNAFDEHMLPRGRSSDWAHDGGIYRPARLLVTPQVFLERVDVDALPELGSGEATLEIAAYIRNVGVRPWSGEVSLRVIDDSAGDVVLDLPDAARVTADSQATRIASLRAVLPKAKLWHFDQPNLYRLEATISDANNAGHMFETTFGVRRFEAKGTAFYLNGERIRLMGVERMAGSNPTFGMAEPEGWIVHDHDDLKRLNCVFTRVHWPQDRRVLDYCDRHGIIIQTEVPAWGPNTFNGMGEQPDADIMQNGLDQLHEMIARDRNHPCIVSWGLCNEINGQNPPAYNFAKKMLEEAKRLNRTRLCSYASHSLRNTPEKDVSGLMDFIACNEYYGSWYPGDAETVGRGIDEIHAAFPKKPIVISEYGYCACTAERPEGDERRREILVTHDEVLRTRDFIAGLIFFCYNDYRTHVGDRGTGVMRQRVHGVVDLYGQQKGSYQLLRKESSPIESIDVEGHPKAFKVTLRTRRTVPSHAIRSYKLRGVYYGYGDIPVELKETDLPILNPGESATLEIAFAEALPSRVQFDVLRPTGFSAYTLEWKP